jgi:hypothetical protein
MYNRLKSISAGINIVHVLSVWFVVNLISASFTLLYSDESYYRLFSQQLAFGYFDHPPMIALFIRIGSLIVNNEAGVRLVSVMAVTSALYLIYRLSDVKNPVLFMAVIFSVFALNLLGFMALPDAPLLFFTVLFFTAYRKFLINEDVKNTLLLSVVMAALLYSKYHGILVIFFTVISNLRLLKSGKFWIAASIGILLFTPHLAWQVKNSFVTFSYHLFERSVSHYDFTVTLEYLFGQILFYGPFAALFMYLALVKYKVNDLFGKALIWNIWGIIGFFLINTFRGRVEVNWTLPVMVPLLIIFMKYSDTEPCFMRRFYYFATPVILIILIFRIQMIYPILKINILRIDNLRNGKEFVHEVVSKSYGLPVVTNSYQDAGIISYYSGHFVPSINLNGRSNQFSLWHADDSLRFRKVAFVNDYLNEGVSISNRSYKEYKVTVIDSFPVMNDITITVLPQKPRVRINEEFNITVRLDAGKPYCKYKDCGQFHTKLYSEVYHNDSLIKEEVCPVPIDILLEEHGGQYCFRIVSPAARGTLKINLALRTSILGTWSTSKAIKLNVY